MKITFQALFTLGEQSRMSFREPLKYTSPNAIEVTIKVHEDGPEKLIATYEVEAESVESIQPLVETEVVRTASLLSWKRGMQILSTRIIAYQYSEVDGKRGTVVLVDIIHMSDSVSIIVTLSEEGEKMLATALSSELTPASEEILSVWRDALAKETEFERYIFLYRLLESLGLPGGTDSWLRNADPTAPTAKDRNQDVSIYKYIRDNIHPKGRFPIEDLKGHLPRFQELVRRAVVEKYPDTAI